LTEVEFLRFKDDSLDVMQKGVKSSLDLFSKDVAIVVMRHKSFVVKSFLRRVVWGWIFRRRRILLIGLWDLL
jgi:hypothetical protein